jgi:hypothetical protein
MVSKKGWIKIIEAFMALTFLLGFLIVVVGNHNASERNSEGIERNIADVLYGIETNSTLRNLILVAPLPYYSNESGFPSVLKNYLNSNSLPGYTCSLGICSVNYSCLLDKGVESDVYSSEILIFSNLTYYSPRKLKMSCY